MKIKSKIATLVVATLALGGTVTVATAAGAVNDNPNENAGDKCYEEVTTTTPGWEVQKLHREAEREWVPAEEHNEVKVVVQERKKKGLWNGDTFTGQINNGYQGETQWSNAGFEWHPATNVPGAQIESVKGEFIHNSGGTWYWTHQTKRTETGQTRTVEDVPGYYTEWTQTVNTGWVTVETVYQDEAPVASSTEENEEEFFRYRTQYQVVEGEPQVTTEQVEVECETPPVEASVSASHGNQTCEAPGWVSYTATLASDGNSHDFQVKNLGDGTGGDAETYLLPDNTWGPAGEIKAYIHGSPGGTVSIDVSGLEPGDYRIVSDGSQKVKKLYKYDFTIEAASDCSNPEPTPTPTPTPDVTPDPEPTPDVTPDTPEEPTAPAATPVVGEVTYTG